MIRNYSISLSGAEIAFILPIHFVVGDFVKITFLDLVRKKVLLIDNRIASNNKKEYFIWYNENFPIDTLDLHERKLIEIFLKRSKKFFSLAEYLIFLSNFINEKFRAFSKDYRFDIFIKQSLLKKGVIEKKGFISSFFSSNYNLTKFGMKIRKTIIFSNTQNQEPNEWISKYFSNKDDNIIDDTFNKLNWLYDDIMKNALLNREWVVIPFAELGKHFPEPIDKSIPNV